MRLELIFFIGIFANLLLAMIFPTLLLPSSTAQDLMGGDNFNYNYNGDIFGSNLKNSTSNMAATLGDEQATSNLAEGDQQEVSLFDTFSNFFDGLFDGLNKIRLYFNLLLPFGGVLSLLPGALGFMFSLLYYALATWGIIKFIRSG